VADAHGLKWQVCGALWRLSVAASQRPEVVQAIAQPALRWITLTVTEKGYSPELGQLLADGLRQRQAAGSSGLTVASCDNLRGNGQVLQALVLAACRDAPLRDWISAHCAFPCSMVDRIVPAMSAPIREQAQAALGVSDEAALGTEAFWEWVIENRFADPSDAAVLQSAGVQVTDQVPVYEDAKLRMLNGSHSAMALIGAVTGRPCISDCIEQPHIREFIARLIVIWKTADDWVSDDRITRIIEAVSKRRDGGRAGRRLAGEAPGPGEGVVVGVEARGGIQRNQAADRRCPVPARIGHGRLVPADQDTRGNGGGLHDDPANKVCSRCRATLLKLREKAFGRDERKEVRP
jgi:hypothetical protein